VKISPGLTFTKIQDGTQLFTIRGVGFNDYTLDASPAVSVYFDQVPLVYSAYTQGATLDLERVEVLKGRKAFSSARTRRAARSAISPPNRRQTSRRA